MQKKSQITHENFNHSFIGKLMFYFKILIQFLFFVSLLKLILFKDKWTLICSRKYANEKWTLIKLKKIKIA